MPIRRHTMRGALRTNNLVPARSAFVSGESPILSLETFLLAPPVHPTGLRFAPLSYDDPAGWSALCLLAAVSLVVRNAIAVLAGDVLPIRWIRRPTTFTLADTMPSDAVYTSAITGATAIFSGLLGYGAARAQRLLEERKIGSQEGAAQREATENARRERRALYLALLAQLDALRPMLVPHARTTPQQLDDWWKDYVDADRQVELIGEHGVREATEPLFEVLKTITQWEEDDPDILAWLKTHREELNVTRGELIVRMRADVGPAIAPK